MKKIVPASIALLFIACLFGSSTLIKPEARVAEVDGYPVTYAELDSVMQIIRKNSSYGVSPDSMKQAALDSLIVNALINERIDSAMTALDSDWEFRTQRWSNVAEVAKKVLFEKQISPRVSADSARVADYYANSKDEFKEQENVKASQILIRPAKPDTAGVKSEKKRQELIDKADQDAKKAAESIFEMAQTGRDWDSLVAAYSEDKYSASRGGDLGVVFKGRFAPAFDSAAFSAEPGSIVGPVETNQGYHIIKVVEHNPERIKSLDDALKEEIRSKITRADERDAASAYLDSLKAAAQYQYNDSVLTSDDQFAPETWVMTVNTLDTVYYKSYKESIPRYMKYKGLDSLTVDDKKDMLSYLAITPLLVSAARSKGYYDTPEVADAWRDFSRREARQRVLNSLKDIDYKPSDKEIEDYFYSHIRDYTFERPLLVHHIIFQDSAFAEVIRDSILAGADFVEMAKKYYPGEPEIREVAYNLDYIGPDDMGRDFFAVADTLHLGEISHPVKTKWGYHIIKLVAKKEDKTLQQVRPGIKQRLLEARNAEHRATIIDQWRTAADIRVDDKLYARIVAPEKKVMKIEPVSKQPGDNG